MKKIFYLFIILIFANFCGAQTDTVYLYTPNGTPVIAFLGEELPPHLIEYYTNYYVNEWPDAELLAPASGLYNCHCYAWNMVEGGIECWLGLETEVSKYWEDSSYVETIEAYAEKIVYFTCVQTIDDECFHPPNYALSHSCIVSATDPNQYESKWGAFPLFRHAPNYDPFYHESDSIVYYRKA